MLSLCGSWTGEFWVSTKSKAKHTVTSLIGGVFDDDIRLVILKISQRKENDVSLVDPHLQLPMLVTRDDRSCADGSCALAFLRIFPRICANRFSPSKHCASRRPFPSIFITCAYSCPSSRKTNSRLSSSFSFFPRLLFFPPYKAQ